MNKTLSLNFTSISSIMQLTEYFLHYVWKYRLYNQINLKTFDGKTIEIIDPGIYNTHAGPDFFNAKIKIEDKLWAGNVEIHFKSNDWMKHGHHRDKGYNSTILHVVETLEGEIFTQDGRSVPQMKMDIPPQIRENATRLLDSPLRIPCSEKMREIQITALRSWLSVLAVERLERKTNDIFSHLERFNNSWDEIFYIMLARNYGFGLNSNEFERLAMSLPFNLVQKHADNLFQLEALMFGQAGMLENDEHIDDYYFQLRREYHFLRHKYALKPLEQFLFKKLRLRPSAFPQIKLAQLAFLLQKGRGQFSLILEETDTKQLKQNFQTQVSEYWKSHYQFGKKSGEKDKQLGDALLEILLINTVVPILFAYGKKNDQDKYCDRALSLLESLKPERNSLVTEFSKTGITAQNAFDSQALIQLRKEYCDKRKCLYCKIGYQIVAK